MNDHEQRWRDAMSSDLAAYDDDDGINNVRCGDIRGMLADLAAARAALVSVQRESDQESARAGKCADDLVAARALLRDIRRRGIVDDLTLAQIDAALKEPRT